MPRGDGTGPRGEGPGTGGGRGYCFGHDGPGGTGPARGRGDGAQRNRGRQGGGGLRQGLPDPEAIAQRIDRLEAEIAELRRINGEAAHGRTARETG